MLVVAAVAGCGRIGFDATTDGAAPAVGFQRTVSITNVSAMTMDVGYAVGVPLAALAGAPLRADLADVRLVRPGGADHDRVIDAPAGTPVTLWFALDAALGPGATDDQYLLLYGDPAAAMAPADGTRVFAFFDDFTAASLDARWTSQGSPGLAAGELTLLAGTNGDGIASDSAADGVPLVASMELRARITDPASAPGQYYYYFGFQSGISNSLPFTNFVARAAAEIHGEHASAIPPCDAFPYCAGPTSAQSTAYRVYRIDRLTGRQLFWIDGTIVHTVMQPTEIDQGLSARNFAVTSDLVIDWVRARAIVEPEPTVVVGPESPRVP